MNWKTFLLGVGVGLIGSYATRKLVYQEKTISSEQVLERVKNSFKKKGSISGTWIHTSPEKYEKNEINFTVYKGGISRTADKDIEHYEFVADARTGTILDIYPL